ncbi:MAG: hypothetical protein HUK08_03425 [Bacteroidaceae bacterium]|nr:hypothetical protein [Bacteroidaceae bacterium]
MKRHFLFFLLLLSFVSAKADSLDVFYNRYRANKDIDAIATANSFFREIYNKRISDSLIVVDSKQPYDIILARMTVWNAVAVMKTNDYDRSLTLAINGEKVLRGRKQWANDWSVAAGLIGFLYKKKGEWEKALKWETRYYDYLIAVNDSSRMSSAKKHLADIYLQLGEEDTAMQLIDEAVEYEQGHGDHGKLMRRVRIQGDIVKERFNTVSQQKMYIVVGSAFLLMLAAAVVFFILWRDMKKRKEVAEASSREKDDFIRHITHEVRTPLNAISGFSQLLKDMAADEDTVEITNYICESNNTICELLKNACEMIDLCYKESADQLVSVLTTFSLADICAEEVESAKSKLAEGVAISMDIGSDDFTLTTSKTAVQRIVNNLIDNACHFTDSGHITVSLSITKAGDILFSVTDTGCGISKDIEDRIFKPYFQSDENLPGLGLGLTISLLYAKHIKARLTYDNTYKEGARFNFILPNALRKH